MTTIPNYKSLPLNETLGMHYSWGVFGEGDQLGTLNKITPETVKDAAKEVTSGESIGLVLPAHLPSPPFFGREPFEHDLFATGRAGYDDRLHKYGLQSSSQWDGFRHIKAREFGLYGGWTEEPKAGEPTNGIQAWSEKGIVSRGVLLDVQKYLGPFDANEDVRFTPDDLLKVAAAENVEIRSGDILCLRFGWSAAYKAMNQQERTDLVARPFGRWAGLMPDESMAEALWDWGIAAIPADNPALECAPGAPEIGSLHRRILPLLGMVIGEMFDFDALADACAADGKYSFLFSAEPLPIVGGVGSPANAVAIR